MKVFLKMTIKELGLFLGGLFFVSLIGVLDFTTGYRLSVSLFYFAPIIAITWYTGSLVIGAAVTAFSALMWFLADIFARPDVNNIGNTFWNFLIHFGTFFLLATIIWFLKRSQEHQKEMTEYIVHDLRTPVTVIAATLKMLKLQANENQKKLIEMAIGSCSRISTLINSMLDYSALAKGKFTIKKQDVRVKDILEESIKQVQNWARDKSVELKTECNVKKEVIRTDFWLTVRVLVNLLTNAIKVSPENAVVSVKVKKNPDSDEDLVFQVQDWGPNIPQKDAERIFEKYSYLIYRKAGAITGSGLGLSFCKLSVEKLGGRMWITSNEEADTSVFFTVARTKHKLIHR